MKLKNKKTGEIIDTFPHKHSLFEDFNSLAELNAEWADYEEPKSREYWYIEDIDGVAFMDADLGERYNEFRKSIGNYFSSREEAEKAVEKLKAWKRLKDKGLRFNKWTIPEEPKTPHIKLVIEAEMDVPDSPYDLDTCFGGEE